MQPVETHHAHEHICRRQAAGAHDRHVMVVCTGEECRSRGSSDLLSMLRQLTSGAKADVRISSSKCLGHCAAAPAMVEDGSVLRWVSLRRLRSELLRLGIL
jgi:NADH:ubiquinone oxidoreductase subunit E